MYAKSSSSVPPTLPPTPTTVDDALRQWKALAPGLELRIYVPNGNPFGQIYALRIDPLHYEFRAHYRPGDPLRVDRWRDSLAGVAAFVNGNLFTGDHRITGLLVSDGAAHGASFQGFGGMFQVQNGMPRVRSLIVEPYAGERLEQAVQAFPMLVLDGAPAYSSARSDRVARRTVVGQDSEGRIILMATPLVGLTLTEMSAYLPATDMNLVSALNLDGGGSTMMFVGAGERATVVPSIDAVPAVLAVYPK